MRPITIRDHQKLKAGLIAALAAYDNLPKKWYRFFDAPGEDGVERAKCISEELKLIGDLSQPKEKRKLEILFAAITQSKVYTSTQGRLRNLILDNIFGQPEAFSFIQLSLTDNLPTVKKRARSCQINTANHPIFSNLLQYSSYDVNKYRDFETSGERIYNCVLSFSRKETMPIAAKNITAENGCQQAVNETVVKINQALAIKKEAERTETIELKTFSSPH